MDLSSTRILFSQQVSSYASGCDSPRLAGTKNDLWLTNRSVRLLRYECSFAAIVLGSVLQGSTMSQLAAVVSQDWSQGDPS